MDFEAGIDLMTLDSLSVDQVSTLSDGWRWRSLLHGDTEFLGIAF